MEESLKRKERLKAMRSEAALASDPNVETSAVPGHLSNPLTEAPSVQGESHAAPRFDFYTDPMAAFSDNRKRGKVDGQGGQHHAAPPNASGWPRPQHPQSFPVPRNYEMNPRPVYQMQNNYSHRSPSPQPMHQGTPAGSEYRPRASYNNYAPDGSFQGSIRPPFNHPGSPRPWHGAMDAGGYSSPPPIDSNSPSFYPRPPGPPDFSHGPAMSRFGNNPMASPGYRGRGRGGYGNNSGFGKGGGGGRQGPNFHRQSDGAPEPERLFNASMLHDPWQQLEPVVWKNSSNSWLPPSLSSNKKERVSETVTQSSSGPSLAEYLAASFHKAVEDSPSES